MRDTFRNRLKELMNYKGLKQIDIVNKTGLDKSLISCYLNGKYSATQDNVSLIAEAYNVNPAWLMGFDSPMEEKEDKLTTDQVVDLLLYTLEDQDTPKDMKRELLKKILENNK